MPLSARDLLARFAHAASLVEAVARPEDAGPAAPESTALGLPRVFLPPLVPVIACDPRITSVLVRGDGIHFDIVLVLDGTPEGAPEGAPAFSRTAEQLQEAAAGCIALTGQIRDHPLPVKLLVVVLHEGETAVEARLAPLRASVGEHKVAVSAAAVDLKNATVWCHRRWLWPDELVGLLKESVARAALGTGEGLATSSAEVPSEPVELAPHPHRPLATLTLLGVIVGMFGAELVVDGLGAIGSPKPGTLLALGGLTLSHLTQEHAFYRLFSCGFLHGGLLHLLFNGFTLYMVGKFVERVAGPALVLTTFMLSLLGGSLASIGINGEHSFTVGASGAIMGLVAGGLILTRRISFGPFRTVARTRLWQLLVAALIPISLRNGLGRIDVAAHVGGAIVGAALGWWSLRLWDPRRPFPHRPPLRLRRRAALIATLSSLAAGLSLGWAVARSPAQLANAARADQLLVPDPLMRALGDRIGAIRPTSPQEKVAVVDAELAQLRVQYSRDPRAFFVSALWELQRGHNDQGEDFLRQGLRDVQMLTRRNGDRSFEIDMRLTLAQLVLQRGDEARARLDLAPVCGIPATRIEETTWAKSLCSTQAP